MVYGYAGKVLRMDLKAKATRAEELTPEFAYKWIGGTGFGVEIISTEVPPEAKWDSPENKVIMSGGMLSATTRIGSGVFGLVTKGPLTGGVTQSQSNGTFGAFLKFCGYDSIVIENASDEWVYLYIDENGATFEDATELMGLDTTETQDALHKKYGTNRYLMSVYCIGPAAEKLAKFAMLTGDYGHVAAHNGSGAVLGAKKVKAICVRKGRQTFPVFDYEALKEAAKNMTAHSCASGAGKDTAEYGTLVGYPDGPKAGVLPVKNLTTTVWPEAPEYDPRKLRGVVYDIKRTPCFGCPWTHCVDIHLHDERFADKEDFEEAEYELAAEFSSGIGSADIPMSLWLAHLTDRVGLDGNEMGWVAAWCIECFERGYFTSEMFDNKIDLHWGDTEGVEKLIHMITNREGKMGDLLANGIKVAAETIGPPASDCAVYAAKGNIPRGHDHRSLVMAHEYLDVNTSSSGTVEVVGGFLDATQHGIKPMSMPDRSDPFMLPRHNSAIAGRRVVEDSIGCCRFFTEQLDDVRAAMTAATGHEYSYEEFMRIGKAIMAAARVYNISSGITYRVEHPSKRYSLPQADGPFAATVHLGAILDEARCNFFEFMGYDRVTGIPRPERLEELHIPQYIPMALDALVKEYGEDAVRAQWPDYAEAYGLGGEIDPRKVEVKEVRHFEGFTNFFDREKPEPVEK